MAGTSRDSWELREESGSLVVEGAEDYGEQLDIKMLLHNEVAGIVPLQLRYVDNQCIYYYLVRGKISLSGLLEKNKLNYTTAYQLCSDICQCCHQSEKFFLNPDHFLMQPEYIFWNPDVKEFSFCYFPGRQELFGKQMQSLCEYLLTVTDHRDKEGRTFVYGLYDRIREREFYISELDAYLKEYGKERGGGKREGDQSEEMHRGKEDLPPLETDPSKADGAVQTVVETVAGRDSFSSDIRRNSDTRKKLSGKVAATPIPKRKKSRKEVFPYYLKNTSKYSYVPERVELDREMLVVGRGLESDVVIPAAQVSWQHARLEIGEDGIYLTDLSSVNGVFLNRKRLIKEHPVLCRVGDIVSFADITYLLCTG